MQGRITPYTILIIYIEYYILRSDYALHKNTPPNVRFLLKVRDFGWGIKKGE